MCLITYRPKGVVLDKDDFMSAVKNNPHGYGFCIPMGDGSLFTQKKVAETTDGEALYDLLHGEFKDEDVLLHLRYTTAGETTLRNAHPFPVLEQSRHGVDVRLMHNGTLSDYKPGINADNKWESDTRVFTRTFVRPLMDRMAKAIGYENLMEDVLTQHLVDSQLTSMSVVAMIDGMGRLMLVNEKGNNGFWNDDGCWFSNKYSHNPDYRYPTKKPVTPSNTGYRTGVYGSEEEYWEEYFRNGEGYTRQTQHTPTTQEKKETEAKLNMADVTEKSFIEQWGEEYGLTNLEDLLGLSNGTVESIAKEEGVATNLIYYLLEQLYMLYTAAASNARNDKSKDDELKAVQDKLARAEMSLYNLNQRVSSQTAWILQAKKAGYDGKAA